MKTTAEAAAWLRQRDHFLILTHRRPDGDTIGSAAALCLGLRQMGKQAELFPNEQFGAKFLPLLDGLIGSADETGKTVVSVDLASEGLLPYHGEHLAGRTELAIDHHGSNDRTAGQSLILPEAAACGEIILNLLDDLGVGLTRAIADALYVAISTDTGRFAYSNTTADTFRAAARCAEAGADLFSWNRILFSVKSMGRRNLESYLTQHVAFYAGGKVALCILPQSVADGFGVTEDDLDDISSFPRDFDGVEIGVMIRDVAEGAKISLRSLDQWDSSALCQTMGGGGHRAAAGATVDGTLEDGKAAVLSALRQAGVEV